MKCSPNGLWKEDIIKTILIADRHEADRANVKSLAYASTTNNGEVEVSQSKRSKRKFKELHLGE